MLTISDVRGFVSNSAYFARGRIYADEGRVSSINTAKGLEGDTVLTARVTGNGEMYDVAVRFDAEEMHHCSCTCPAYERAGMCKHVAAALIAYCEGEDGLDARRQAAREQEAREQAQIDAYLREQARFDAERREVQERTQRGWFLDSLLRGAKANMEDGVRLRHEAAGDVRLYPVLVFENGKAYLELKIGKKRAYVVRSLQQFGEDAARGACVQFGKELTFSHTEEELHPDDVALYREIAGIAARAQDKGARTELTGMELDSLMRLLINREVEVRAGGAQAQQARVTLGDAQLSAQLSARRSGYELLIEQNMTVFGARGAYCFCAEEGEIRCALGRAYSRVEPLARIAQQYPQGMPLDAEQMKEVATRLLIPAGAALDVTRGKELLLALTPMAMKPRFLVDTDGRDRLTCEVVYDYGAVTLGAAENNPHVTRDVPGEEEAVVCAKRVFPKVDAPGLCAFEGKEEQVFELLTEKLPELAKDGEVLVAERVRQMNVQRPRAMTFGMTKNGTQLLVKADLGGLTQQDLEAAYAAYRQKKKYIRLEDGTFLSGGALKQAAQTAEVAKGLNLTAEELAKGASIPMNRAMYLDAALKEREEMKLSAEGELEDFIARLNASRDVQAEPPKGLKATLRPYQLTGYHWLRALCDAGFGGILADDMGLGKTLQALALLLAEKEKGNPIRALVVCPSSLQLNWLKEAKKFTPDLSCVAMLGSAAQRKAVIDQAAASDVLIVSYDQLRRDVQAYHGQKFTHVLLDEAQNIKNAASQGAKAVKAIDAEHRFAMTGTPIENRLSELWSIFDFLMPGYLLTYKKFKERFEAPIVQDNDEDARKNLRLLVAPFILRRMKKDVLTDLPEKVETVMESEMTAEQRRLYLAHAAKLAGELDENSLTAQKRIELLSGLTRLRQLCCEPSLCLDGYMGGSGKLEQCVELVKNAVQADHEILLFSQFTSMLDILKARLEGEGMTCFMLKGDTPKEERMELVERFNAGEADVFLISLKAGGTGLNLTGADVVIHYDPWWNTAAQNQATDRAYRIGQTQSVQVYKLIASDTIEERILLLQQEKAALSDAVLTGDEGLGALDEKTMRELLL